jgi:hypothetical protein
LARHAKQIVERTQREVQRSRQERAKDIPKVVGDWGAVDFQEEHPNPPKCSERNELDKSILLSLARLTQILHRMIRISLDGDPESASAKDLKLEHHLECGTLESLLAQWKDHKRRHKCH